VMEKPWALNQSHLQKIIESSSSSKMLGIDHYLWKPEVRQFLKVMQLKFNLKLLQESDSFDFILCEPELDPKNRTYFWKTGVAIDMIPHILPLLDRLFDNCTTISIEKAVPAICDDTVVIDVLNNLENVSSELNSATPTAIKYTVKETFAEIILILLLGSGQRKLIHVVLGKGIIVPPILICSQTTQSQKFLYGSFGNIFLDLNNHNITLQCKKRASNETESPWYNIFKSLASRKYSQFVDIESIQKYVSLYPCILNKLNHSVNQITGKEYTSGYARLLINSNELRYSKGKKAPLLLKHPGCCFNNSRNINK
jgi:hypothetical protein